MCLCVLEVEEREGAVWSDLDGASPARHGLADARACCQCCACVVVCKDVSVRVSVAAHTHNSEEHWKDATCL